MCIFVALETSVFVKIEQLRIFDFVKTGQL
jgi:hypothetical protein